MDRIGVFTHDFQILYLFETRETLEFVLNNSFEGSLYTRRRWWFCCYLYKWYNLWCKTLSNKQSTACYSRFNYTKTRNISKFLVGARWCNFKRLLGSFKLERFHSSWALIQKTFLLKRGASSRWSFHPNSAWDHREDAPQFTAGYFARGLFQNFTNVREVIWNVKKQTHKKQSKGRV